MGDTAVGARQPNRRRSLCKMRCRRVQERQVPGRSLHPVSTGRQDLSTRAEEEFWLRSLQKVTNGFSHFDERFNSLNIVTAKIGVCCKWKKQTTVETETFSTRNLPTAGLERCTSNFVKFFFYSSAGLHIG